uniref:NADH-ubiquinone oxidoreductase chain 4L n=1 Tax=Janus sp. TaxID=3003420 RepID=A0A9E8Z1E2_9HYME|nr:NADH dehydrogenase subunit 4L [Janus sp.]
MNVYWGHFLLLGVTSLMVYIKFSKHLLFILLSLEFFVIIMFYIWFAYFNSMDSSQFMGLYYLIFSVCESVLGLSIMITIMRSEGSVYLQSFSVLKW